MLHTCIYIQVHSGQKMYLAILGDRNVSTEVIAPQHPPKALMPAGTTLSMDKSEDLVNHHRCCWDLCARGELGTGKAARAGSLVRPRAVGDCPTQNTQR